MSGLALALLIGFLGGVAITFQSPLASLMSERIGSLESAFIIHLGGALVAGLLLIPMAGGGLGRIGTVPWYALAAGVLGILLIVSVSYTIPRIGITGTLAIVIVAQLALGLVLDHHGILVSEPRPYTVLRLAGVALLLLGAWLITRPSGAS